MNLHQKLIQIAKMAGVLRKTKEGFNYKYTPEEDIQAKVTAGLQKYGVMLYHSIVPGTLKITPISYEKYDKRAGKNIPVNEVIVSADTTYTWVDVDSPSAQYENTWVTIGQMEDAAQAFGAGETYCNRYFLMKSLQLATTESDPDEYRSKQKRAEESAEEEKLADMKALVIKVGKELIKKGVMTADGLKAVVAEHNNGNSNPNSISSTDVCEKIIFVLQNAEKEEKKEE